MRMYVNGYLTKRKITDIEMMAKKSGLKKIYFETLSDKEYETELLKWKWRK